MIEINSDFFFFFFFLRKALAIYISKEQSTYLTIDLTFRTERMYPPHHPSSRFEILSS